MIDSQPRMPSIVSIWALLAAACFSLLQPGIAPAAADLAPAEVRQLSRFEQAAGLRDVPEWARAEMEPKVQRSYEEARSLFAGRGPDVARHFLAHTDFPPGNSAYFFLLEALADTETALVLIQALWASPKVESGPPITAGGRTWLRERDKSEIRVAIESVLVNETVRSDPRTVSALTEAMARLRPKQGIAGAGDARMVVGLLGRCAGPEAKAALEKLAEDPDPEIRSLAVQGLGQTACTSKTEQTDKASILATLIRALSADPDARARLEAATALGRMGTDEAVSPLKLALANERNPQVIDAIVLALQQLKAPLMDPQACHDVAGRTWEPSAGRFPFACWRASASREEVLESATEGTAQMRAMAMYSLVSKSAERRREPLLTYEPRAIAPPPPPAPQGAGAVSRAVIQPPRRPRSPQVSFDDATRERLLASAVEVLSKPSKAFPGKGGEISFSTAQMARDALWEISGRNMSIALTYTDRISTPGARYATSGRFGASYDLWNKDRAGYLDYRRPRQAARAGMLALMFSLLLVWKRTRRAGATLVVAALVWGVWSLSMTQIRELPPPPLQFLTVSAIALLSAGISVASVTLLPRNNAAGGPMKSLGRAGAVVPMAAVLAFFACGLTRWNDIFPIGGEGWELIFDPIGSALLATVAAVGLALLDGILLNRFLSTGP